MPKNISDYQNYEEWKRWDDDSFGVFSKLDEVYYHEELKRTGIKFINESRIYEIGFGNGSFAGFIQSMGYQYFCSEVNQTLVDRARSFGLKVYENGITQILDSMGVRSFDAIVAFDVLEHLNVEEIRSFLFDAHGLLKKGGVVLARVPSGDSPFGRAIFHGDVTHLTALGSMSVIQLAHQTGFEVLDIGPPRFPIIGVGYLRAIRRSSILLARSLVAKFINLIFHDGESRVITANMVFILKKKSYD
jgi:2-polyprenyl-3-methyl-5-hydroxy-6-metoxy-1,4-benzoquinol methylase